jgi:TRAP-type C4-dicarboxylate transport system substrate-binding protein
MWQKYLTRGSSRVKERSLIGCPEFSSCCFCRDEPSPRDLSREVAEGGAAFDPLATYWPIFKIKEETMKRFRVFMLILFFILGLLALQEGKVLAEAKDKPLVLKISHQWPAGTLEKGDFRDRLCRIFAKRVEEQTGGALKFEIFPASALSKPIPQYDALLKGALDFSVYPLDYAAGKIPQLSITLMPCIVKDHAHAMRWKDAPIGKEIEKICEQNGMKIITWAWCGGGLATKAKPVVRPEDLKGLKIRAAGKMFERMLYEGCSAAITSMPSSEIYFALQTGVLDACMTSSSSFESYRLYEQVKYYNSPRLTATWYMFEPFVISMVTWKRLSPAHQKVVTQVGKELEKFSLDEAIRDDTEVTDLFKAKGVIVHDMTPEEQNLWRAIAEKTAWKYFSEKIKGGKDLLRMALTVK